MKRRASKRIASGRAKASKKNTFFPLGDVPLNVLDDILMQLPRKDIFSVALTSRYYRDYLDADFWARWCTRNDIAIPPPAYIEWIKNRAFENFYQYLPTRNPLGTELQSRIHQTLISDDDMSDIRTRKILGMPVWVFQKIRPSFVAVLKARSITGVSSSITVTASLSAPPNAVSKTFHLSPQQMEWSEEVVIGDYPFRSDGPTYILTRVTHETNPATIETTQPVCRIVFPAEPRMLGKLDFFTSL